MQVLKKLVSLLILSLPTSVWATHLTGLNANNITLGTLPNARLDPSSVTLQGNSLSISTIASGLQELNTRINSSTATLSSNIQYPFTIIVGTSATRNASIISTTTLGFQQAISSCGAQPNGCTIWGQRGGYTWQGSINVPPKVTLMFEDSATFKLDHQSGFQTVFNVTGTVMWANIDVTTSIYALNQPPVVKFGRDGRMENPRVRVFLTGLVNGYYTMPGGVFYFGPEAVGSQLIDPVISSFTIVGTVNPNTTAFPMFSIDRSSHSKIIRPFYRGQRAGNINNARYPIYAVGWDNFIIEGGHWELSEQLMYLQGTTPNILRGFKFINNTVYSDQDAGSSGFLQIECQSVSNSSGNVISHNTFVNTVAQTNPTIALTSPGVGTSGWDGFKLEGNTINNSAASTGACFSVSAAIISGAILQDNQCIGSSTFISDSGGSTKYTGLGNFLGSTEQ